MEIFKDVPNYEGIYLVSNTGKIISKKRLGTPGGKMTGFISKGYRRVLLSKNGNKKNHSVHRIVAETFIDNPFDKPNVNHIDGNKKNNHVSNLEWCTDSENQLHAYRLGLQKVNVKDAHKVRHEQTKISILQFDLTGNFLREFESIKEAANTIGIKDGSHISAVAKGKRKKCGGYIWKYK